MSKSSPPSGEPEGAYHTDHPRLREEGNIRLRYTKNPGGIGLRILEEDHYYPFGLKHQGYNNEHNIFEPGMPGGEPVVIVPVNPLIGDKYKYKFNGMEWQNELDLNFYDFGMRNYDPALGRWMNIDPLAEQMRRHSPYNFAFNNPIRFIDPGGMQAFDVVVNGNMAEAFTEQLNTSTNLEIARDADTGQLSIVGGEAITAADKALQSAINDTCITVDINATSNTLDRTGNEFAGGAFEGSTINEDGTVTANQSADPNIQGKADEAFGRGAGVGAMHEVLEGYVEGTRALETGVGSDAAGASESGKANYQAAHNEAKNIDPRYNSTGMMSMSSVSKTIRPGITRVNVTFSTNKNGNSKPLGTKSYDVYKGKKYESRN